MRVNISTGSILIALCSGIQAFFASEGDHLVTLGEQQFCMQGMGADI